MPAGSLPPQLWKRGTHPNVGMTKEKNTADTAATMKLDSRRKRHWGLCRHKANTHRQRRRQVHRTSPG